MPTDVALVLTRKAETRARAVRGAWINGATVLVWATFGLVLSTFEAVFDPGFALALIAAG